MAWAKHSEGVISLSPALLAVPNVEVLTQVIR